MKRQPGGIEVYLATGKVPQKAQRTFAARPAKVTEASDEATQEAAAELRSALGDEPVPSVSPLRGWTSPSVLEGRSDNGERGSSMPSWTDPLCFSGAAAPTSLREKASARCAHNIAPTQPDASAATTRLHACRPPPPLLPRSSHTNPPPATPSL